MRILKREPDMFRLRIDCEDDLWVIARICVKKRSLGMLGERRDQTTAGEEGGRAKSAERKKMWIRLAIESNEFHTFSDNLRVHGIIEEAKFDHGSHHTHLVEVGDEIELTSQSGFPLVVRELISDAVSSSGKPKVAIIVVENDEAILFEITGRGIREVHTWTRRGGGKYTGAKASDGVSNIFFQNLARETNESISEQTPLILCGPGHAREKLAPLFERQKKLVATSMGGRGAVNEVITQGLAGDVLSDHSMVQETALLEEAFKRIATNGAVAYGRMMIEKALAEGAIETLLVNVDLLRSEDWEVVIKGLSDIGAKLIQCSTDHDAGDQLAEGYGGAVALLRYRM